MRRALWIIGIVALAAVIGIGISQAGGPTSEKTPSGNAKLDQSALAGSPAPLAGLHQAANEIRPSSLEGYQAQLRSLRGYPVVVNAWASWCGPCKIEFPVFRKVATQLGKKVAFVGLNVSDNVDEAKAFLKRQPVPYPSLEDGSARIVQKAGAAGGLPTTIFYDKQGKRAYIHQGNYRSAEQLIRDIKRYTGA
jgi:thiol-disulfide isomerase/thioredoxin